MDTKAASQLAHQLLNKHGLSHLEFKFNRRKKALGVCYYRNGEAIRIELSHHWTSLVSETEVKDTILHEIAHALAGHEAGHGPEWQAWARKIGARPERTARTQEVREAAKSISKYTATCTNGHEHYFNRMGRRWKGGNYRCNCGGSLTIKQNY